MNFTEFRLKARRFLRKNGKILLIIFLVWVVIFLINYILRNRPKELAPTTTYAKHTSVIDSGSSVPSGAKSTIEGMIEEYVGYCNEGNYQKAFNMLSESCREYEYKNDVELFMEHVLIKMPTPKKYFIQDYSNIKIGKSDVYIYEVKYTDDFLATGLTNDQYRYIPEKFTFFQGDDGLEMCVGDYIYEEEVKRISENEYLKVDVLNRVVNYSIETYTVKFTNKTNYTVVISDGQEVDEVILNLPNEYRSRSELYDIVLGPNESTEVTMVFKKFVDDGDDPVSLTLSSVRVMEKYSGVDGVDENVILSEIDNAIAKFSMSVNL